MDSFFLHEIVLRISEKPQFFANIHHDVMTYRVMPIIFREYL